MAEPWADMVKPDTVNLFMVEIGPSWFHGMDMIDQARFQFIQDALHSTGGFRPKCNGVNPPLKTELIPYPREDDEKFARRNQIAWYVSDLFAACQRFAGYLSLNPPARTIEDSRIKAVADNMDGQGSAQNVFWTNFTIEAKARGLMLLLVDMDAPDKLNRRDLPFCQMIYPEHVKDLERGDDGLLDWIEFAGTMLIDGKREQVTWYFDRQEWKATKGDKVLASGVHPCGECPVLIFSESGQFPAEGQFSQIADLSKRLFNAHSELDEMMRAVTFPMFGLHVPPEHAHLVDIGDMIETIGTQNAIKYYGETPTYIAPPNGPAEVYFQRIKNLRQQIDEIGLKVEGTDQQESGIALQMRFQALNSALAMWAERMEDFEKRVWELVKKWLGITWDDDPEIKWERNFILADVAVEMSILQQMQDAGVPEEIIREQIKRVVSVQFGGLGQERLDEILASIGEAGQEVQP